MFLSTFLMEEAKHSEFFMLWHDRVVGVLEPDEVAAHFLVRSATIDPTGRFQVKDVLHEALPRFGGMLMEAVAGGGRGRDRGRLRALLGGLQRRSPRAF